MPLGINDAGEIDGYYFDTNAPIVFQGFVEANGVFFNTIAPGPNPANPEGINDPGEIVGFYSGGDGDVGFVGTPNSAPVPEPAVSQC